MKSNRLITIFLLSFSALITTAQNADQKKLYVAFTYIKINPGKASAYFNLIKNYSPKITANRISQGGVLGWYMYELRMPTGTATEYDLISMTVADDFKLMFDDLDPSDETMRKIMGGMSDQSIKDIFAQYESSRTVIKKEIFVLESNAVAQNPASKYIWMDYLKGETPDPKTEQKDASRALFRKSLPVDNRSEVNYLAATFSNDLSQFSNGIKIPLAKVKGGVSGSLVHSEIWQLVEYVDVNKIK